MSLKLCAWELPYTDFCKKNEDANMQLEIMKIGFSGVTSALIFSLTCNVLITVLIAENAAGGARLERIYVRLT